MSQKTDLCPLLKKECIKHACAWYAHMTGKNPQTGHIDDIWDCAVKFLPILLIESSNTTRGVQAAVESARNEAVTTGRETQQAIRDAAAPNAIMHLAQMVAPQLPGNIKNVANISGPSEN